MADEPRWREAVEAEMRLRGYTAEEIDAAEKHSCFNFGCLWDENAARWICEDDEGNSIHPVADEYGELVGVIGRALGEIS